MSRIVILTEGRSNPADAKTACALLRYRGEDVVALLDSTQVGRTAEEIFQTGGSTPFVKSVADVDADTLLIGIAPAGGDLPPGWRSKIREALERGMDVVSGLHLFLGDDPEFSELAKTNGVKIQDLRKPAPDLGCSKNIARDTSCFRVHTVGVDCNVGKMHAAIEVAEALKKRNFSAEFVATGQTGILISGWGVPIDRVVSDFLGGAIEELIVEHQDNDFLVIEGQGSLIHPVFSGVTLGLLHGCAPQAMILCYDVARKTLRHVDIPVPPLEEVISHFETLASVVCPSRVIGFCVNTSSLSAVDARAELASLGKQFGLPAVDPVRFSVDPLVDAIVQAAAKMSAPDAHSG